MTAAEQGKADQKAYTAAMIAGNADAAIAIEKKHGLYGYPPEIVSVGLAAAANGENVEHAVQAYLYGDFK